MRELEPEVHPAHLQNGPPVFIRPLVDIVTQHLMENGAGVPSTFNVQPP